MKITIHHFYLLLSLVLISCSDSAQVETESQKIVGKKFSGDTLIILSDTAVEFDVDYSVQNRDSNYFVTLGGKNESFSSHGNYKIELKDVNKVMFTVSSIANSSPSKPNTAGIIRAEYKGKDITKKVKKLMRMNPDGFSLHREPEYEALEKPITISLKEGYMIFLHREYILEYGKLEE